MQKWKVSEMTYDVKNRSFEAIVTAITAKYKDSPLPEVKQVVEEVCEAYVMEYGRKPDSYQLTLLANLILKDDISNPAPNKVQKEAYPFHSDAQRKRRNRKEFVAMGETIEFMNYKNKNNLSTAPANDNK